jgi:purine-binding chemotaxis protein CheW
MKKEVILRLVMRLTPISRSTDMDTAANSEVNQFLTFVMENEQYAFRVSHVREVLTVPKLTKIPRMPDYMKGVVNIRGSVIPIIDLKKKFGMGDTQLTTDTAIIVVEICMENEGSESEILHLGIFADSVKKVIAIQESEIEPPPKIGSKVKATFIEGMGHSENDFIVILNITEILSAEDYILLESAQEADAR